MIICILFNQEESYKKTILLWLAEVLKLYGSGFPFVLNNPYNLNKTKILNVHPLHCRINTQQNIAIVSNAFRVMQYNRLY